MLYDSDKLSYITMFVTAMNDIYFVTEIYMYDSKYSHSIIK